MHAQQSAVALLCWLNTLIVSFSQVQLLSADEADSLHD